MTTWPHPGRSRCCALLALFAALPAAANNVAVLTQHNDTHRTGANLQETVLTPANVVPATFGKIWAAPMDSGCRIGGQPLYLPNTASPGTGHNTVYVVTSCNVVLAYDADNGAQLWRKTLDSDPNLPNLVLPFVPSPPTELDLGFTTINTCSASNNGLFCNDHPSIGIASTPVIDPGTGAMYLVTRHHFLNPNPTWLFLIHALSVVDGHEMFDGPHEIAANGLPGHDYFGAPRSINFWAMLQNQRAGLLLANNRVYAAFGSWEDQQEFHGWVFGFAKDNLGPLSLPPKVFLTSPDEYVDGDGNHVDPGGGIWQAGAGLIADDSGFIYAMVGNGSNNAPWSGTRNVGQAFIKLDPDLNLVAQHPADTGVEWYYDCDLGSSGPILLPTGMLAGAGKAGWMHVMNTSTMSATQDFKITSSLDQFPKCGSHHVHGSPVFVPTTSSNGLVFVWPEDEPFRNYLWSATTNSFTSTGAIFGPSGAPGMPGGQLSVSANGTSSSIVWATTAQGDALHDTQPGTLWAFDATAITSPIWTSEMLMPDTDQDVANLFSKGANPTIANGKVFIGAQDWLDAYGLTFCSAGSGRCQGTCLADSQAQSDPLNCGTTGLRGCHHVCAGMANGFPLCSSGACTFGCNAGFTKCQGSCWANSMFNSDVNNCGSCGHACSFVGHANRTCSAGICGFQCISPYHLDCDGNFCISGTQECK